MILIPLILVMVVFVGSLLAGICKDGRPDRWSFWN